jgi:UDP-2,3-diacylglucosamine hydrolase
MRLIYVSDLHLRDLSEEKTQRFVAFLKSIPSAGDILILGGDIFDLLIGNKAFFRRKFQDVCVALAELKAKNISIHYLEGNHDFHIRDFFSGLITHPEEFQLEWQGKKIWIAHGDLIDPEDRGYRFLRFVTRSLPLRLLLLLIPGAFLDAIGRWSSRQSRKYHDVYEVSEERKQRLQKLYSEFAKSKIAQGSDFVLVGHSHLEDQLSLESGGKKGEYLNLGFSAKEIPYAVLLPESKSFSVKKYP